MTFLVSDSFGSFSLGPRPAKRSKAERSWGRKEAHTMGGSWPWFAKSARTPYLWNPVEVAFSIKYGFRHLSPFWIYHCRGNENTIMSNLPCRLRANYSPFFTKWAGNSWAWKISTEQLNTYLSTCHKYCVFTVEMKTQNAIWLNFRIISTSQHTATTSTCQQLSAQQWHFPLQIIMSFSTLE